MEIIPDKRSLSAVIENAYTGKLCLPNFQRDFVWTREQVADLLRSVLRRYFIGSLLLLRCDPQKPPFAPLFVRGANPIHKAPHPELLILDGQQRISALLYALSAPDLSLKDSSRRRWFFVDLKVALDDIESDGLVFDYSDKELDGIETSEEQYRRRILPCTAMMTPKRFLAWRDGLDDFLRDHEPESHKAFRAEWRERWTALVTDFQHFDVPLVELPMVADNDADAIGRVCAIFEKLNSTGVELSVYDLLTARLYRHNIRIHDLWRQSCSEHKLLNQWSSGKADSYKFGVMVLRTIALLRNLEAKPKALINLSHVNFEKDWYRAAGAIERALQLMTHVGNDGFGIFNQKWTPLYGQLPVLAALRAEIDERKLGEGPRSDLRRWYWSNVFLERYSSAIESKSRKDYAEFLSYWVNGGPEPSVFGEARLKIGSPTFTLADALSPASAMYCGVFCLLAMRGAQDWRRGEDIALQDLQDHHIFPRAFLRNLEINSKAKANTILNRTLISDETNGKIKDKAPAEYLSNPDLVPGGPTNSLMSPHFLSDAAVKLMQAANQQVTKEQLLCIYEPFLKDRERAITAEVRQRCGVSLVSVMSAST